MMESLSQLTPQLIFGYGLVFCRIGCLFMLLPGLGDMAIPARYRLSIALPVSLLISPLALPILPSLPAGPLQLVELMAHEIILGLFIGSCVKIMFLTLELTGTIYAQQLGLANASILNPSTGNQSTQISNLLMLLGGVLIFSSGLHHIFLQGIVDSYKAFPIPPTHWQTSSMLAVLVKYVGTAFNLAIQLSAPVLILGTIFFLALGLLNRLMPQMMIFFISQPAQIGIGFFLLMLCLQKILNILLESLYEFWSNFYG